MVVFIYCFIMPPSRSEEGHIVLLLSVALPSVCPSLFVVLFLSPKLPLQYVMQAFENCNIVQTCIEHVPRGNRYLIQVIIAELCRLNNKHILTISHRTTFCVSATPPTVFNAGI